MTESEMPDPRAMSDDELAEVPDPPAPDDPDPGPTTADDAQAGDSEGAHRDAPAGEDYAGSGF